VQTVESLRKAEDGWLSKERLRSWKMSPEGCETSGEVFFVSSRTGLRAGAGEAHELAKRLGVGDLDEVRKKALYLFSEVQPKLMVAAEQLL
jgi:hypothetical protein